MSSCLVYPYSVSRLFCVLSLAVYFVTSLYGLFLLRILQGLSKWIVNAHGSLDLFGSLLYALAMIAIMVGLSEVTSLFYAKYLLAAGFILFLVFLYGEWHRKSPVLPVRIFADNRVFSCSSLAAMLNYCATFGISFLLSIYLQRITGLNARDTGLVLLLQPVLMALLSPVTGALSDRINPAVLASSGMILITFGLSCLAINVSLSSFWLIALALVIIGIGFALFTAPNNNAIMGSVASKYYGAASSVVSTVRLIGQVLSVAIITLILSQSGAAATSTWLAQHIQQAFIVFTVLCAIGIIPSAARSK